MKKKSLITKKITNVSTDLNYTVVPDVNLSSKMSLFIVKLSDPWVKLTSTESRGNVCGHW